MSGDKRRGDAVVDQWSDRFQKNRWNRELAVEKVKVRAEHPSQDFEENSAVILEEALRRQHAKQPSEPPGNVAKGFFGVAKGMKSDWAKVASLAILVGFLLASAYLALR